jgi:hypothetical protein
MRFMRNTTVQKSYSHERVSALCIVLSLVTFGDHTELAKVFFLLTRFFLNQCQTNVSITDITLSPNTGTAPPAQQSSFRRSRSSRSQKQARCLQNTAAQNREVCCTRQRASALTDRWTEIIGGLIHFIAPVRCVKWRTTERVNHTACTSGCCDSKGHHRGGNRGEGGVG